MFKKRPGFMTTELMVVAIVLAILSGIATAAVPSFANRAKRAALSSTLAVIQGATDRYFVETNSYPVLAQPLGGSRASVIDPAALDGLGRRFTGHYLHTEPNSRALDYALSTSAGPVVHFGVTASGRVFATQSTPTSGEWSADSITVYTQENVEGALTLAGIW